MNTKQKIVTRAFLFMTLIVLTFNFSFSQSVKFEYKLDKGKTYTYSNSTESKTTMTMMGTEQVTSVKMSSLINLDAVDILPDGKTVLNIYYDSLKIESDSPQMPDISGELAKVNGKKVKGIMSKSGKISDITPIDEYSVSDVAKAILSQMNVEKFASIFQGFPDKDLQVNDTWTESKTDTSDRNGAKILIKTDIEIKYTGKSLYEGKDAYKFVSTSKGTMNGTGSQQGADFTITGTTKSSTDSYFSDVKGIFLSSKTEGTIDMTIDVSAMGMTMPMTVVTTSAIKLIK